MTTREKYRVLAQSCIRIAGETTDDYERQTLQEMAAACARVAELDRRAKTQWSFDRSISTVASSAHGR